MFLDETVIEVFAGRGGDGCVSFKRKNNLPFGGPDGGDGADGGSVIMISDRGIIDFWEIGRKKTFKSGNGQPGLSNFKSGIMGEDLIIYVPVGTVVKDLATQEIIYDFVSEGLSFIVCQCGRGGRGNASYKSSINQTPREFQYGTEGEIKKLFLELRVIADIGLVGLPNAGKSTFLGAVTAARPKIANFPFTTLNPNLGVINIDGYRRAVIADLPGLIEGSSTGKGLGIRFLKHVQRTRLILHLIDVFPDNGETPANNYRMIRKELESYDKALTSKHELVVLTKQDKEGAEEQQKIFDKEVGLKSILISSILEENLPTLIQAIGERLQSMEE
jgi:GTP-binding protein